MKHSWLLHWVVNLMSSQFFFFTFQRLQVKYLPINVNFSKTQTSHLQSFKPPNTWRFFHQFLVFLNLEYNDLNKFILNDTLKERCLEPGMYSMGVIGFKAHSSPSPSEVVEKLLNIFKENRSLNGFCQRGR